MDDKYIISNTQQGQSPERKGAVGPSNVAVSGEPDENELLQEGPESIPSREERLARKFAPISRPTRTVPGQSMGDTIGKKPE